MESPRTNTFSERMLKRASSRTLLRRRAIIDAIEDRTFVIPVKSNAHKPQDDVDDIEEKIKSLDFDEKKEINSETRIISQVETISETPKQSRKVYKPNMESTRTSLTPLTNKTDSKSPQVESTISSIQVTKDETDESRIPYEVERFLEEALGDELNNTTVTYGIDQSDMRDRTNSHFTASELISEDRSPFYRRITEFLNYKRRGDYKDRDDGFMKGIRDSSTLDRSIRVYRSLSQRIKKTIRGALLNERPPDRPSPAPEPPRPIVFDKNRMDQMENILKHMKLQQCMIQQASKALNVCHSSKEFIGSSEEVESERLLLLAQIRKRLLQEELKKLSNTAEDLSINESSELTESAEVTIQNISLCLRECLRRQALPGETVEWFVIVIIEGTNVWGSPALPCPIDSLIMEFPDFSTTIDNLKPDLKIILEVYSLKLRSGVIYNHEDKYHIGGRLNKTFTCPSPTKLLKKMEKPSSPRKIPIQTVCSSSFAPSGHLELVLHDLTLSSPWPLTALPVDSILLGTIDLQISCKLHLSVLHQGFVNYGDEAGGFVTWNRRWCVLKGHSLMFWNYPREQESKAPLNTIDLINCVSERIKEVSRALCAKPRTVVVENIRMRDVGDIDSILVECRQSYTIHRHLLSFDTKKDLTEWTSQLNHVISALREWNVTFMKDPPKSPMVSDL